MMKTFKGDFDKLLEKLKNNQPFFFQRFSDGEMMILKNQSLKLSKEGTFLDNQLVHSAYPKNDHKEFDKDKHQYFREKLIKAYQIKDPLMYIGTCCPCCISLSDYKWMINLYGSKDDNLSWSNLWMNSNYNRFIKEMLPELKKKKIVLICNENAKLENSGLNIIKDFRVGENCLINNFDLHLDISKWIEENNIENHVFLFSASSLSNITIYELFKKHKNQIMIDIGSVLDPILGLGCNRDYLRAYWNGLPHPDLNKTCILL